MESCITQAAFLRWILCCRLSCEMRKGFFCFPVECFLKDDRMFPDKRRLAAAKTSPSWEEVHDSNRINTKYYCSSRVLSAANEVKQPWFCFPGVVPLIGLIRQQSNKAATRMKKVLSLSLSLCFASSQTCERAYL